MTPRTPEPVVLEAAPGSARPKRDKRRVPAGRIPVSKPRTAAFTCTLVLLIAAVPTLGLIGWNMIRDSKAGTIVTRASDPRSAGYEAIVDPTPTALVVQKNAKGLPVGLTFLALGGTAGGGSALFLPIQTAQAKPVHDGDNYGSAFVTGGDQGLGAQVGATLNAGVTDVIDMDDQRWAALTAKTAPIRFDNPDALTSGPLRLAAGPVALRPTQVGAYLAALNTGESELNRLNRNQVFWDAWLQQITASTSSAAIPGETGSGLGFFLRTMSEGPVRLEPLPVVAAASPREFGQTLFQPVKAQVRKVVAATVPYPTSPSPAARVVVRLLNGVNGEQIPQRLVDRLVQQGASIAIVGNDAAFGHATTVFQYRDRNMRKGATQMQSALGGKGKLTLNVQGSDAVDVSIVLGRDVLPAAGSGTGAGATTTRSQTNGG